MNEIIREEKSNIDVYKRCGFHYKKECIDVIIDKIHFQEPLNERHSIKIKTTIMLPNKTRVMLNFIYNPLVVLAQKDMLYKIIHSKITDKSNVLEEKYNNLILSTIDDIIDYIFEFVPKCSEHETFINYGL